MKISKDYLENNQGNLQSIQNLSSYLVDGETALNVLNQFSVYLKEDNFLIHHNQLDSLTGFSSSQIRVPKACQITGIVDEGNNFKTISMNCLNHSFEVNQNISIQLQNYSFMAKITGINGNEITIEKKLLPIVINIGDILSTNELTDSKLITEMPLIALCILSIQKLSTLIN